ncbi:hypothetical protein [Gemmata palustris]|nr:hypothetical protein [Gemmata palustris]
MRSGERGQPCRCPKKTKGFIEAGHVDPDRLLFASRHALQVRNAAGDTVREIEDTLDRQYADIFRDHPFHQPPDQVAWLRQLLDQPAVRTARCATLNNLVTSVTFGLPPCLRG